MKYNNYYNKNNCTSSASSSMYTVDKGDYTKQSYPNPPVCDPNMEYPNYESKCECNKPYGMNQEPKCSHEKCERNGKVCSNCDESCQYCAPLQCNMNCGNVEGIKTLIKRIFTENTVESYPISEELTLVDNTAFDVTLDLIKRDCKCDSECPEIDMNSKFTCNCVEVEVKEITLANDPEVKLNGKELTLSGSLEECFTATIDETMLKCAEKCQAEKADLYIKAEGWSIDAVYTIWGCVETGGKLCDFKITVNPDNPIAMADSTVLYMNDFCVNTGELQICFDPKVCLKVNSIVPVLDGTEIEPSIDALLGLNIKADLKLVKEQLVCIQGIVIC